MKLVTNVVKTKPLQRLSEHVIHLIARVDKVNNFHTLIWCMVWRWRDEVFEAHGSNWLSQAA